VAEGETIPETDPEFGTLEAEPKAIKGLAVATSEALEDSSPSLASILQNNMLTRMALRFDAEALVGGSSHGFNGLTKLSGTQVLDANYTALDSYDVFIAAAGLLAASNIEGPYVCVCHPFVATALARLREKFDGEKESNQLLAPPSGLPSIYPTPQIGLTAAKESHPQYSTVLIYAPSALRVVRRLDAVIETDRSSEWDTDKVAIRGKARATVAAPYPAGVVRIDHVPAPAITL
jgi:HK97 family phage major capsid protein